MRDTEFQPDTLVPKARYPANNTLLTGSWGDVGAGGSTLQAGRARTRATPSPDGHPKPHEVIVRAPRCVQVSVRNGHCFLRVTAGTAPDCTFQG